MDIKTEQSMEQAILSTAERLFLEKGFKLTSTTEIAKVVGCNQALVHYYFRTKENLFNNIFEQKFKTFFQKIFEIENLNVLNFQDKLKFIVESHFDMLNSNQQLPALIINELLRQPKHLEMLRDKLHSLPEKLFADLNADLQKEIAAGNIRDIQLIDIIYNIISLNVFMFLMKPVIEKIMPLDENKMKALLLSRKNENVNFVLNSLRP